MLVLGILLIVLALLIFFGNSLVFLSFIKFPVIKMKVINYFFLNLAIVDCVAGVYMFAIGIKIIRTEEGERGVDDISCRFLIATDLFIVTLGMFNILLINISSFWYIAHPLSYSNYIKPTSVAVMSVVQWVFSALITFPPIIFDIAVEVQSPIDNSDNLTAHTSSSLTGEQTAIDCPTYLTRWFAVVISILLFYAPLAIMLYTTFKTLRIIWRHKRAIQAQTLSSSEHINHTEYRGVIMMIMVIITYILTWLPFFTYILIEPFRGGLWDRNFYTLSYIGYLNFALNPITYAKDSEFRAMYRKLLCGEWLDKNRVDELDTQPLAKRWSYTETTGLDIATNNRSY